MLAQSPSVFAVTGMDQAEAKSLKLFMALSCGEQELSNQAILPCIPRQISRETTGSRAAQTGNHREYWHHGLQLKLLFHNANPDQQILQSIKKWIWL